MKEKPTCPHCDDDLDRVVEVVHANWNYNSKHGTYERESDYWHETIVKCAHCRKDVLPEVFGERSLDDFNFYDEIKDYNGVKRCCAYCKHFDSNNDEEYSDEYEEGSDGWCREGMGKQPVYHKDKALAPWNCNAFKLDPLLENDELFVDEDGVIQGC